MEEKQKEQEGKEKQVRKWKGKDWFVILAPEIYGKTVLSETPATDPKALIGRIIEISFAELSGNPSKYYMKLMFRIEKVDGKKALTQFNGYAAARDYLFRVVRKRTQKIRIISNMETKDKWKLQITALAVLNRNTETGVQKTVRAAMETLLRKTAEKLTLTEFLKIITEGSIQLSLKKTGTKIYPVRFAEIEKLEVVTPGLLTKA